LRDKVPFAAAVPEDRPKESVCPKRTCVTSKKEMARIGALEHFAINLVRYASVNEHPGTWLPIALK
jgi:hypothetical protein